MDTFRQNYTSVNEENKARIVEIKAKAQELHDLMLASIKPLVLNYELSLELQASQQKLRESIMWITSVLTSEWMNGHSDPVTADVVAQGPSA